MIRNKVAKRYRSKVAEELSIIYGGSVNAQNARSLFQEDNIDGALVGGASLKADDFLTIINSI
jgi:triosephosphate isomerase